MEKSVLRSRYLLENIFEGVAVILVSIVAITVEFLFRLKRQATFDNWNLFMQALNDNSEMIQFLLMSLLIAVLVFIGVSTVTLYLPLKTVTGKQIVENLGNGERID